MRKLAACTALIIMGALLGTLLTSHVWIREIRLVREATLAEFLLEQEALASQARRRGDSLAWLVHASTAADCEARTGFHWLIRSREIDLRQLVGAPSFPESLAGAYLESESPAQLAERLARIRAEWEESGTQP